MTETRRYQVLAIPLNRPEAVDFLLPPQPQPRGAPVVILQQRPTLAAQTRWLQKVAALETPTVCDLLALDDPHTHLAATTTDRLVPLQFLRESDFLTRNLGGWAAIYFGIVGLPPDRPADPLLQQAEVLVDYGAAIRAQQADPAQVEARLPQEMGATMAQLAAAWRLLAALRPAPAAALSQLIAYVERLYAEIVSERCFGAEGERPLPRPLLLDELLGWLVVLEQKRRAAAARADARTVEQIATWQAARRAETGLHLILKGEYIVGRHRRSTVLIAPELDVVVKQPGPEPFHEIVLGAKTWAGQPENWPMLTHDQSLVTPRGRVRQLLNERVIPRLHRTLDHPMSFYTLLGLTIEPFVVGPTTQELVWQNPAALTPALYETYVLHQQVAELSGAENGDWHSANFVVREGDGEIVHIDWGAARPLRPEELTSQGRLARLNQVQNIAFSFHDTAVAARVTRLHEELLADPERLVQVQRRAQALVDGRR